MIQPFICAAHLGNRGAFPAGDYWLVECRPAEGETGPAIYWVDDYDREGRTGFDYIPQRAAGFRTKADAETAWAARGCYWPSRPRVLFVEHRWE